LIRDQRWCAVDIGCGRRPSDTAATTRSIEKPAMPIGRFTAASRDARFHGFGPFDDDFDPFEDDEETDVLLPLE
jgi:hypothetical protein